MRPITLIKKTAPALLLLLAASGVVSAKVASGPQNLSANPHQAASVLNPLLPREESVFSTTRASDSSVVPDTTLSADEGVAWSRQNTVGRTPGKASPTGRAVIERMRAEGNIVNDPVLGQMFKGSDGEWYPLKLADMSHKTDAVSWWNSTGRAFGAKSPEVRSWMLDPNNYYLDYYSINRSQGALLGNSGVRYLPPLK